MFPLFFGMVSLLHGCSLRSAVHLRVLYEKVEPFHTEGDILFSVLPFYIIRDKIRQRAGLYVEPEMQRFAICHYIRFYAIVQAQLLIFSKKFAFLTDRKAFFVLYKRLKGINSNATIFEGHNKLYTMHYCYTFQIFARCGFTTA